MLDLSDLDTNFRFLVVKVTTQVEHVQRALQEPEEGLFQRLKARDDYIDQLKSNIESRCFSLLQEYANLDRSAVNSLRSMNVITANLEHIADFSVSIARQMTHFHQPTFFQGYDYQPFFDEIFEALRQVLDAFWQRDAAKAMQICRAEIEIDRLYKARFEQLLGEMQAGSDVPDRVTSLLIFHYMERMGDALLNVGEAILFNKLGDRLKLNQYQYLRDGLAALEGEDQGETSDHFHFQGIWGTRSGCRIGKVSESAAEFDGNQEVIYKGGDVQKIRAERDGIQRIAETAPGVAPRVVEYQEGELDAAILLEYLEGKTLQQIVLDSSGRLLRDAMRRVQVTARGIWLQTKTPKPVKAGFLHQLSDRLEDIYTVHPEMRGAGRQIGELMIPSFEQLLSRNLHLDDVLCSPFSVLGHGDFNLDNIIYNPDGGSVHYLDLHRSRRLDYVQDVSVFLVSNFRLPVFDRTRRRRTNSVTSSFFDFANAFAREQQDDTFDARLCLGVVRSLVSSTRFEFHRSFATEMLDRAMYLLRLVESYKDRWESIVFPEDVILF